MTRHSRAGQMFTDARYQPHGSSVRVAALAARVTYHTHSLSTATASRITQRAALPLRFVTEDVGVGGGGSPCAFHAIREDGSRVFISVWFILAVLFWPRCNADATFPQPLPPPPFVMWKQPFSCGDFLSLHPDAWHSWQIGCGSEGDGLWKQCPCPPHTHTLYTHTYIHEGNFHVCVTIYTHTHTETVQGVASQNKVTTWM